MIDYSNEIFTKIAKEIRTANDKVKVIGESLSIPSEFPCVTIDETHNIPFGIDGGDNKYSAVTYRVQVFSNKKPGKRAEARQIFSQVSDIMYSLNLIGKTYTTTPAVYNNEIYEIQATFEGVISKDGRIYRR